MKAVETRRIRKCLCFSRIYYSFERFLPMDVDDGSQSITVGETPTLAQPKRPQRNKRKKTPLNHGNLVVVRYKQKYIPKWEKIPEYQAWLTQNKKTGSAYCMYCGVDINIKKGKTQLSRHGERMKHRKNERLWHKRLSSRDQEVGSKSSSKFLVHQVQHAEAQLVAFLVENNLSINLIEPLVAMLKKLPLIGEPIHLVKLPQEKAVNMITQGILPHFNNTVVEKLKKVLFSIVMDEATDKDDNKYLVVCVSYCNDKLQTQVDVLETMRDDDSTVESIFEKLRAVMTKLEEGGVHAKNWVGFLIDTTNALFVTTHHIAVLINEYYPWVIPIRSPCHMAHLAASSACEKLPPKFENFCKSLYSHFRTCSDRPTTLLGIQAFCRLNSEKVLAPGQDQWISVHKLTHYIIEMWEQLETYFTNLMTEDLTSDYSSIIEILKDPLMKAFFQFIEHVLSILSTYNKTFQMEEPLFFQLQNETTELVCKFALSFMRKAVVKSIPDMMQFSILEADLLPLQQLYIGLDASITLSSYVSASQLSYGSLEVVELLETCQFFYKEIILQIQARFDFSHSVFHLASIINPQNALNIEPASLSELFATYDHPDWNKNDIESEWRAVSNVEFPLDEEVASLQSPLQFWRYVLAQRSSNGSYKFKNLQHVIQFFLSLPFSSIVGVKVSRFLKRINISGRINLLNTDMSLFSKFHYNLSKDGNDLPHISQKQRQKNAKKDTKIQHQMQL